MQRPPLSARLAAAAVLGAALAVAWPGQGFWLALPVALAFASAAASPRTGLATAAAVLAGGAAAGAPTPVAAVAGPACVAVLLATRTRLEREREAMRRSAHVDPLTGLANRRAIDERLRHEVARHLRYDAAFSVVVLDLDGFKPVNDRYGHEAGDELLRDVAEALLGALRGQDTVGRLGGDEFCVIAPGTDRGGAAQLCERLAAAVEAATSGLHFVSASTGTAVFPADGHEPDELLAAADGGVLEAKRRLYARRPRRRAA